MDPLFRAIELSAFSVWLRESTSVFVYPTILSAHAIGMGLVVGVVIAMSLVTLGLAGGLPGPELRRFEPFLWIGFVLNAASGVLLLLAYPTKALTNPVFYLKLVLMAAGTWMFLRLRRRLGDGSAGSRWIAGAALVSWAGAITAGRLLAYTYRRLFVDF